MRLLTDMIVLSVQALDIFHFTKIGIERESAISHESAEIVAHLLLHLLFIIRHPVGN